MNAENKYHNTKANDLEHAFATHPGSILKDEIEYRGISQYELSQKTGIPYTVLNEILNGHRALTEKTALLLQTFLGIDAEPLLALQTEYNLRQLQADDEFSKRLTMVKEAAKEYGSKK